MGIFDFGPDFSPSSWGDLAVTPGSADANNMSLAEKLRLSLLGSTDKAPGVAAGLQMAGKGISSLTQPPAAGQSQQHPAAAAAVPGTPGASVPSVVQSMQSGRSPFAAAPTGQPGPATAPPAHPKPPRGSIWGTSPFEPAS
jgi:hypothetical protein